MLSFLPMGILKSGTRTIPFLVENTIPQDDFFLIKTYFKKSIVYSKVY